MKSEKQALLTLHYYLLRWIIIIIIRMINEHTEDLINLILFI
jgi:hypothetical protein